MNADAINIYVVDDHPVVLEGLVSGLGQYPGVNIVGSASDVTAARSGIDAGGFDLLVMDLNLPTVDDGLGLLRFVTQNHPACKVMVLTYSNRPEDVFEANAAGAHAYLVKDCDLDEIAAAFETVMAGGRPPLKPEMEAALWERLRKVLPHAQPYDLSEREWNILRLLTEGATNEEIAAKLFISPRVVRRANTSIYQKLNVRNRSEAISMAMKETFFS
ncbi:MAG: response regulator transcription factor [Thermoleophilia bacterium]